MGIGYGCAPSNKGKGYTGNTKPLVGSIVIKAKKPSTVRKAGITKIIVSSIILIGTIIFSIALFPPFLLGVIFIIGWIKDGIRHVKWADEHKDDKNVNVDIEF